MVQLNPEDALITAHTHTHTHHKVLLIIGIESCIGHSSHFKSVVSNIFGTRNSESCIGHSSNFRSVVSNIFGTRNVLVWTLVRHSSVSEALRRKLKPSHLWIVESCYKTVNSSDFVVPISAQKHMVWQSLSERICVRYMFGLQSGRPLWLKDFGSINVVKRLYTERKNLNLSDFRLPVATERINLDLSDFRLPVGSQIIMGW